MKIKKTEGNFLKTTFKVMLMTIFLSASTCTQAMDLPTTVLTCAIPAIAGFTAWKWSHDRQLQKSLDAEYVRLHCCNFRKNDAVNASGVIALFAFTAEGLALAKNLDPDQKLVCLEGYAALAAAGLMTQIYVRHQLNKQLKNEERGKENPNRKLVV